MKRHIYTLLALTFAALTLASCGGRKVIYENTVEFDGEHWLRQDNKEFDIDVKNVEDCYDIYMTVVMDTSCIRGGKNLPLVMDLYTDNGERRNWYTYIQLRGNDGKWLYPLDGKYITAKQKIKEYFFFNQKGNNRLEIHHGTDRYEIYGIKSMELSIEKAKLIYPD